MDKKKAIRRIAYRNLIFLFLVGGFFIGSQKVMAASLLISPSSNSYYVGQVFSVSIVVSTEDQSINAVSGVLSFPTDKLSVNSISKSSSIINLWVKDPTYSNYDGTVNFEGVVLNPGFTGNEGRIIKVNFRAKAEGTAMVTFSTGNVLANDGSGTSVMRTMGSATYTIGPAQAAPNAVLSHFDISEILRSDTTDPHIQFKFNARDSSAVSRYEVTVDSNQKSIWHDDGSHIYKINNVLAGDHTISVTAYDINDHALQSVANFHIDALPIPHIDDYTSELRINDFIIVKGSNCPANGSVVISVQRQNLQPADEIVQCTSTGNFTFVAREKAQSGMYTLWAKAVNITGAESATTNKITIAVNPTQLQTIGYSLITMLIIIIPLLGLIIILIAMLWHAQLWFRQLRRKVREESNATHGTIHKTFTILHEDLKNYIHYVSTHKIQHHLSQEEQDMIEGLKDDLANAEHYIEGEIKDIEKLVK